ncbi:hypothetical protein J6590_027713 [Homalodisca vitripennis]|nr:hypothetical protein J6590_027713 [Homalodisca vitripennis]
MAAHRNHPFIIYRNDQLSMGSRPGNTHVQVTLTGYGNTHVQVTLTGYGNTHVQVTLTGYEYTAMKFLRNPPTDLKVITLLKVLILSKESLNSSSSPWRSSTCSVPEMREPSQSCHFPSDSTDHNQCLPVRERMSSVPICILSAHNLVLLGNEREISSKKETDRRESSKVPIGNVPGPGGVSPPTSGKTEKYPLRQYLNSRSDHVSLLPQHSSTSVSSTDDTLTSPTCQFQRKVIIRVEDDELSPSAEECSIDRSCASHITDLLAFSARYKINKLYRSSALNHVLMCAPDVTVSLPVDEYILGRDGASRPEPVFARVSATRSAHVPTTLTPSSIDHR